MKSSFELDHTKVDAPYVRVAGDYKIGSDGHVRKFDVRLGQPNEEILETGALHTLEHLMSVYVRRHLSGMIDMSPMGCRTGFYLVIRGKPVAALVRDRLKRALLDVIDHKGPIPGATLECCGNYLDHDLEGAQNIAKTVMEYGLKVQKSVWLK